MRFPAGGGGLFDRPDDPVDPGEVGRETKPYSRRSRGKFRSERREKFDEHGATPASRYTCHTTESVWDLRRPLEFSLDGRAGGSAAAIESGADFVAASSVAARSWCLMAKGPRSPRETWGGSRTRRTARQNNPRGRLRRTSPVLRPIAHRAQRSARLRVRPHLPLERERSEIFLGRSSSRSTAARGPRRRRSSRAPTSSRRPPSRRGRGV